MQDSSPNIKLSQAYVQSLMDGIRSEIASLDGIVKSLSVNVQTLSDAEKYKPDKQDLIQELKKLEDNLNNKFEQIKEVTINLNSEMKTNALSGNTHNTNIEQAIIEIKNSIVSMDKSLWKFMKFCGISFFIFMFLLGLVQAGIVHLG